ncbi:branched-chain amino acid ABC transporter peripl asmic protein [Desulfonema ishimotonii]|uniref:Branched-chain amino acid ABC transporter peripl asmic protein n=1 Tax=Desulfonema ishimotonii TaxID=45657 RepID=A0A401FQ71_9BACT|nr:penicillin-binding protein activator [Desulfonema ishimotonii]GBC59136.1 branched-chain amino acid ABC transporter peripl asmic protein [Desulfonema ishimotonii]
MKPKHNFLILLAVLLISACAPPPGSGPGSETVPPDQKLFTRAEKAFRLKNYQKAMALYNRYLSEFPDGTDAPEALMREAAIYRIGGDDETARKVYQYLLNRYPESSPAPDAMTEILKTLYREEAYEDLIRRADGFLKQPGGNAPASEIHALLGDTYMKKGSPVNAVWFYARAGDAPAVTDKLKSAIRQLDTPGLVSLMERIQSPTARGCLMYQLGVKAVDEGRNEDGLRTLTRFTELFPDHEYGGQARQLIRELEVYYESVKTRHTIGCLLPLSGAYETYGKKVLQGIELAMEQANAGDGVRLVVKDTGSSPTQAVMAVESLAQSDVSAIIGPIITAEQAASGAQGFGIPIITLTQKNNITAIGDYVFRNFLTPQMQVRALVAYATENLGAMNFAILYPDEKYGQTFTDLFRQEVTVRGGNVTASEAYHVSQTDFTAPIRRLTRQGRFEALFIPDGPRKTGLIIPQLAYHEVRNIHLLGTNLWHSPKLIKMARRYAQGAIMPDIFSPESRSQAVADFLRSFQESFGTPPGFMEALAYDTTRMLLEAFHTAGVRHRSDIRDALMQIRNFQGVTGNTSFDGTGEAEKSLYLLRIEGNRFVEQIRP